MAAWSKTSYISWLPTKNIFVVCDEDLLLCRCVICHLCQEAKQFFLALVQAIKASQFLGWNWMVQLVSGCLYSDALYLHLPAKYFSLFCTAISVLLAILSRRRCP